MNGYDIQIDLKSLDSTISKIDKDLTSLEEEMNNVNNAYQFLDKTKWSGPDKRKIDNGFGIYLKDMTNFSDDLRNTLKVIKDAFSKYEDIEKKDLNIQELEEL